MNEIPYPYIPTQLSTETSMHREYVPDHDTGVSEIYSIIIQDRRLANYDESILLSSSHYTVVTTNGVSRHFTLNIFLSSTYLFSLLLTILGLEHVETCVQFHPVRIVSHRDAIYRPVAIHVLYYWNHSTLDAHRNHPVPWLDLHSILASLVPHEFHKYYYYVWRMEQRVANECAIENSWQNSEVQWTIWDAGTKRSKIQRGFSQRAIDLVVVHLKCWPFLQSALQTVVESSLATCTNANPMIPSVVVSSHVHLPFDSRKARWLVLVEIPLGK